METVATAAGYPRVDAVAGERSSSAVSWAAIVAGAVVAAATSLLLITLGAGVGLSTLSPWPNAGTSATTFAVTTAIGLIVVQWLSAAVGGYIAGRMRTKWASLHTHEVFFRDTAHGFITWAAATLLVVWAAASISGGALGAGVHAAATVGSGAAAGATTAATGTGGVDPYEVDTLLRPASPTAAAANNDARGGNDPRPQVTRILGKVLATDQISPEDQTYLTQLVVAQTGASPSDAQARVDNAVTKVQQAKLQAQQAADTARKAARAAAIFTGLAMLIGAFIASISAALGGRLRDLHP